jgi:hypothetical protein
MSRIKITVLSATVVIAFATASFRVQAQPGVPINGNISFASGFLTFDTSNIGTAKSITGFSNVVVGMATGAYGSLSNAAITWTPFTFNPPAASVKPLWTFTTNGVTSSFDATSVSLIFQNSGFLNLRGSGVAHMTGYADTPGTWTLAAQLVSAKYTFSATAMTSNSLIPTITYLGQTNGYLNFSWNSVQGQSYQLQFTADPGSTNWQNLGDPIVASGTTVLTNDSPSPAPRRFYRVVLQD